MQKMNKRKWYKTPWKLIVFVVFCVYVMLFALAFAYENYLQNVEMRHRTMSAWVGFGLTGDGRIRDSTSVLRYDTVESSVHAYVDIEFKTANVSNEIKRFEAEGCLLSIYSGDSASYFFAIPFTRQTPNITLFLLETDGDKYSAPQYVWLHDIETMLADYGVWYDKDRVARDVIISHFRGVITSRINNGTVLFYGAGMGEVPDRMTILGDEPDSIIPFAYNEEDYYMWYYRDMEKLSDILETHIDFDAFTFAEIIELLDIEVLRE